MKVFILQIPLVRIMNKGFVTTFILVIVMSFTLAGALSVATRSVHVARYDRIVTNRAQAIASANACAEEALQSLKLSPTASSGSVSTASVSCTYTTVSNGGSSYTITGTGTYGGVSRSVFVDVSSVDPMVVGGWDIASGW